MAGVTLNFRDGRMQRLEDYGASGGSYSQTVRYEGEFVIITDAHGKQTAHPMDLIQSVEVDAPRRW